MAFYCKGGKWFFFFFKLRFFRVNKILVSIFTTIAFNFQDWKFECSLKNFSKNPCFEGCFSRFPPVSAYSRKIYSIHIKFYFYRTFENVHYHKSSFT